MEVMKMRPDLRLPFSFETILQVTEASEETSAAEALFKWMVLFFLCQAGPAPRVYTKEEKKVCEFCVILDPCQILRAKTWIMGEEPPVEVGPST